jgi:hypothetical protein
VEYEWIFVESAGDVLAVELVVDAELFSVIFM